MIFIAFPYADGGILKWGFYFNMFVWFLLQVFLHTNYSTNI